ncbi:MAG: glycoside hydrolase, partial [Actinobacteria bacterium]|nr:glycoside hydrolase [Actinomycetota bacterium]
ALDTAPFSGGYGMRGAVERPDGVLVLPLGDVPGWRRSFVVFSTDGGRSWCAPTRVAEAPGRRFNEPSAVWLRSGRLLLLMREDASRELYRTWSDDGGASWAPAVAAGISGYPPHLLVLPDDRILCVYGHRRPPYSIRAALSRDGGESWNPDGVLVLRDSLPARDLGYPSSILRRDGRVCTVYYTQDTAGVTGIEATMWRVPG